MAIDILDVLSLAPPFVLSGPTPPPVPPTSTADVCVDATRTRFVYLSASTDHARQCDGGTAVANAALKQKVEAPPGGVQLWEFTLPSDQLESGGIAGWTIAVGFAPSSGTAATHTENASIVTAGVPDFTDAVFTIELDTADLSGFTFGSVWAWDAWRTDDDERELLAGSRLTGITCVTVA